MPLVVQLNGQTQTFAGLDDAAALPEVIAALELKPDRVAVELNGEIVARSRWAAQPIRSGDKLEVVHFVGGGSAAECVGEAPIVDSQIELRPALPAEYPEIVALANLAYRGAGGWSTEAGLIQGDRLTEDRLRRDVQAVPHAYLLTVRESPDAELLGTVWLEPQIAGTWYLGLLTVHPDRQGSQLGRRLLNTAERFAKDRGAARIGMTVLSGRTTLLEWYQRRGYVFTGDTQPFPYDDQRFGIALRGDLYFLVLEKVL